MFQFTYKLKISERVKAKCDRLPAITRSVTDGRHPWRMLDLLLTLRSAPGKALARRRPPGISASGDPLDADTSAARQAHAKKRRRGAVASRALSMGELRLQLHSFLRPQPAGGGAGSSPAPLPSEKISNGYSHGQN